MTGSLADYHAYLLRLWRTAAGWCASLEDAHTGERRLFATLDEMVAFLEHRPPPGGAPAEAHGEPDAH